MRADTLPCSVPNCPNLQRARGWCATHWSRWRRFGDPLRGRLSASERFWPRVEGGDYTTCWEWQGPVAKATGYGVLHVKGKQIGAHRFAYEDMVAPIPGGLQIDHLCRNRLCVNPWHLEPVTARVNSLRSESPAARNVLKTQCPQGHPYDEENTRWKGRRRICKECDRAYRRRVYSAQRAAA